MKKLIETILLLAALIASLIIVGWFIVTIKAEAARMPRRILPTDTKGAVIVKYQDARPVRIQWVQA